MAVVCSRPFCLMSQIERMEAPLAGSEVPLSHFPLPIHCFGITRVADLTELDVIGIPVWSAMRPNARGLSVSQGKGLNHEQARISAIMESIEGAVAEQTRTLVSAFGSVGQMQAKGRRLIDLQGMVRCRKGQLDQSRERAWVRGFDYRTREEIFAPYELVGMDMRVNFPWDSLAFHVSSVGLAAGLDFSFAASRALLEAIEHDAVALIHTFGLKSSSIQPLSYQAGLHRSLDEAVCKIRHAGLTPYFFHVPNRVGVPTIAAAISRPVLGLRGAGERLSGGYASRLDPYEAALSAILEAVQSRLTNIAGARDDMDPAQYEADKIVSLACHDGRPLSSLASRTNRTPLSSEATLEFLAGLLHEAGQDEIGIFPLPTPLKDVHVVRVLVPGLRTEVEGDLMRIHVSDLLSAVSPKIAENATP